MVTQRRPKPRARGSTVTVEPKGYEPKRIYQRLRSDQIPETLSFDPRYVPWFYVDNILQRVLARTYGQGPLGPVPIRCNEEGSLYVAGVGGAYTRNEVTSGAAPDAYAAAIVFSAPMGRIDLSTFDNKMVFKRSRDGVTWDDEIELFKDSFYSFDCVTKQFNIKNYAAGLTARFQCTGWF
jgi:hypothetical protein